jgi:hypothetical protein
VIGKAKVILTDKLVVDGKSVGEIRRQVVDAHMGDVAKGWNDDQVTASFASITAKVTPDSVSTIDAARNAFNGPPMQTKLDARDKAYNDSVLEMTEAWKPAHLRQKSA